jgi:predicted signal transduction protein with EAL and GGDEF domain
MFTERVRRADAALGPYGRLAVLLVDLDRFKEVNDTLGHASGDLVLREVGVRLNMTHDADDAAIVRSTIELAHNLGLQLVAEGIEDQKTLELLTALGCDLAQGYHLARPMPADELVGLHRVRSIHGQPPRLTARHIP